MKPLKNKRNSKLKKLLTKLEETRLDVVKSMGKVELGIEDFNKNKLAKDQKKPEVTISLKSVDVLEKIITDLNNKVTLLEAENKRLKNMIKEATENALELNKNDDIQCQETKT